MSAKTATAGINGIYRLKRRMDLLERQSKRAHTNKETVHSDADTSLVELADLLSCLIMNESDRKDVRHTLDAYTRLIRTCWRGGDK